jgi:metallo-beta-lactamase family protein
MRITFFGAAGEVTGSAYLLETSRARVLVDFGLHQGEPEADAHNQFPAPIDPTRLDAVILTHAHIDHSGRLPMLAAAGFRGPIFATGATRDLCEILLKDAAFLQAADAARAIAHRKPGDPAPRALFDATDVELAMRLFRVVPFEEQVGVAPGLNARWIDAGHILGAASVEVTVEEPGTGRTIIGFSGDIGPRGQPIIRDPTPLRRADVLFLESTYGDRDHRSRQETIAEFDQILTRCRECRGKILIPSFAVGRTQDLIYELARLHRAGHLGGMPVYIDSPLGIEATELYRRYSDLFDTEMRELVHSGRAPLSFSTLRFSATGEDSRRLNDVQGPVVIIAGAGMCNGGRIVHHLKHNLPNPDTQVVIVGYQGQGTLGRRLVDGAQEVRIHGQQVAVKARIHTLGGFSAHAGQTELVSWAKNVNPKPRRLILTHGEPRARDALRNVLIKEWGVDGERPVLGETIEL